MYINLKECPLCGNSTSELYLEVKDHMVSFKPFHLVKCKTCSFIYTNPRPSIPELDYFYQSEEYVSHLDHSRSVTDRIYFLARQFMLRKKLNWLNQITPTKGPLLDYGCGTGTFLNYLLKNDWEAWGIEPNQKARKIANENSPNGIFNNLADLPVKRFQVITLWHVLEHIHDLENDINLLLSFLADSAYLITAVPNCNSSDAKYYGPNWAGYDVPRHLSHFTPETMKVLAKKHRLQLTRTIPLKLDAYYISMLSEKSQQGSLFNAFIQGYKSNQWAKRNQSNYSSLIYVLKK